MPATVAIRFPFGRYHGTPWGRNVNEGVVDWPPEPWRFLRALYATWKARVPDLPESTVQALFDALAAPPTYDVPPYRVAHTRHYYPDEQHGLSGRGGTTDKTFDTFAVVPRDAELRISWPVTLDPGQRVALARLCDQLTYLGRADSICIARLADNDAPATTGVDHQQLAPIEAPDPVPTGAAVQPVLAADRPLQLAHLEVRAQRMRRSGRLEPVGSRRVIYPIVEPAAPAVVTRRSPPRAAREVTAVRLRMTAKALPAPQAALAMTEALRQAVIRAFDPKGTGRGSVALFGKDAEGTRVDTNHGHAHYLAFTSADADHRLLDTLVIWAPKAFDDADLDAIVAAAAGKGLYGYQFINDFRPCKLAVEATGPVEDVAPELVGHGPDRSSARWRSATPYAPPRNVRRQPTWAAHAEAYLRRDLAAADLSEPVIEPAAGQWLSHRRHRLKEDRSSMRRATGFTVRFAEPVRGPLCFGGLRHLGLGLFLPDDP